MSKAEEAVCRALRALLDGVDPGAPLNDARDEFLTLLGGLEFYLPAVLRELYPFWRGESLDGFNSVVATRTGPLAAELAGLCQLISDQSWTPFDLSIRISSTADAVEALSLGLGERVAGTDQLLRLPCFSPGLERFGRRAVERRREICWVFVASFGLEDLSAAGS